MQRRLFFLIAAATSTVCLPTIARAAEPKPLRVGIIGLDTSHATSFTQALNKGAKNPEDAAKLAGAKMVAAYPKGSPDIETSTKRVPEYTEKVKSLGGEIVGSIEELVGKTDAILLETNDGRPHLEQIRPVLKAKLPVFVDKPMAASLADVLRIFDEAKKAGVPIFSSSSLRFGKGTLAVRGGSIGKVLEAETVSPVSLEPTHPDLFWYGIHGVESLFTVMGTGCVSVKRGTTADGRIEVIGTWEGGRKGTFRQSTDKSKAYGGTAKGEKGEAAIGTYDGYDPLLVAAIEMFRTGKPPVSMDETVEIYAFMEAADESKRRGGAEVTLKEVLDKAKAEVAAKP